MTAILNVCGFVVSFSVLLAVLNSRGTLTLLCGFLSERLGWALPFSRALIADPYMSEKVLAGKRDEVTPCLRCWNCSRSGKLFSTK